VGFTAGWDQLAPWLSSNNVDTIVQQCGVACSTAKTYDFCSVKRTVKAEDGGAQDKTCNELVTEYSQYGVEPCPALENEVGCKVAETTEPDAGDDTETGDEPEPEAP